MWLCNRITTDRHLTLAQVKGYTRRIIMVTVWYPNIVSMATRCAEHQKIGMCRSLSPFYVHDFLQFQQCFNFEKGTETDKSMVVFIILSFLFEMWNEWSYSVILPQDASLKVSISILFKMATKVMTSKMFRHL